MTLKARTKENRFFLIGLQWTQDPLVLQVLLQHDWKPSLVEGFHDDGTNSLVVGEEVEDSEEEEETQSQSEG